MEASETRQEPTEKEGPRFRYSCAINPDPRETFAVRALAAARTLFEGQRV
jgi:hypothetical protein